MKEAECPGCYDDNINGEWRKCAECGNFYCTFCITINNGTISRDDDGKRIPARYYCPSCIIRCSACGNILNTKEHESLVYRNEEGKKRYLCSDDNDADESCLEFFKKCEGYEALQTKPHLYGVIT